MMHKKTIKIGILALIIFTFFISPFNSVIITYGKTNYKTSIANCESPLDSYLIYNITENLSNIIFTEYDGEAGEIAKGRAFGTKGELRAIEIIAENLTNLDLDVKLEPIKERPGIKYDENAYKLEVLDYEVLLDDKKIDCYVAPSWGGSKGNIRQLNTTFNFSDLKIFTLPKIPCLMRPKYAFEKEDFVFIINDQWNDPNYSLPLTNILKPFLNPLKLYMKFHVRSLLNIQRQTFFWRIFYPKCRGLILYDFNPNCHDMIYFGGFYKNYLPVIFINGTDGNRIMENPIKHRIDYNLKQRFNQSVVSYNVIGQLNGTDQTKTVIVSSLIDSWWNQGTADSAIAMAMVVAIAKYYKENNITPNYNMKFIAFCGEECDMRGATYYEALHKDEEIIYMIDLNQLGFTQNEPRLTFDITSNNPIFLNEIWDIAERTDYVKRTGNSADIQKVTFLNGAIPSNPYPFVAKRPDIKALSFFKDGGWILHHRDGLNHTEGDVLKYFNWTDVNVTSELVLNITKYLTIDYENENNYSDTLSINTGPIKAINSSLLLSTRRSVLKH